jgi:hypothetical protein
MDMKRFWLLAVLLSVGCSGSVQPTGDAGGEGKGELDECNSEGQLSDCEVDGQPGARVCQVAELGFEWSACGVKEGCEPGDTKQCFAEGSSFYEQFGNMSARCELSGGRWMYPAYACATPLVLSFDDAPVEFTRAPGEFDLFGQGMSIGTDWVSARTPWLALDSDRDGHIADGRELFGSMTVLPSGARANDGFEALSALDADHDGWITPRDPAFDSLQLWSDGDQNRRSAGAELSSLSSWKVEAIGLAHTVAPRCNVSGCELERGRFVFRDANGGVREGAVIDVHLRGF